MFGGIRLHSNKLIRFQRAVEYQSFQESGRMLQAGPYLLHAVWCVPGIQGIYNFSNMPCFIVFNFETF